MHREYWIPAVDFAAFSEKIVGTIAIARSTEDQKLWL